MAALARISAPTRSSSNSSNLSQLSVSRAASTSTSTSEDSLSSLQQVPPPASAASQTSAERNTSNTGTTQATSPTIADKYGLPSTPWGSIDWRNVTGPQNISEADINRDKDLDFVEGTMYKLQRGEYEAQREAILSRPASPRNVMQMMKNIGPNEVERMYEALGEDETRRYLQTVAANNRSYQDGIANVTPQSNGNDVINPTWSPYSEAVTQWAAQEASTGRLAPDSKLWERVLGGELTAQEYPLYLSIYQPPEMSEQMQSWLQAFSRSEQNKYGNTYAAPTTRGGRNGRRI